jgi:hypothetical protein
MQKSTSITIHLKWWRCYVLAGSWHPPTLDGAVIWLPGSSTEGQGYAYREADRAPFSEYSAAGIPLEPSTRRENLQGKNLGRD